MKFYVRFWLFEKSNLMVDTDNGEKRLLLAPKIKGLAKYAFLALLLDPTLFSTLISGSLEIYEI